MVGVAAVTNKGQRVFVLGVLRCFEQLHAHHLSVKIDRALKVANAKHGV